MKPVLILLAFNLAVVCLVHGNKSLINDFTNQPRQLHLAKSVFKVVEDFHRQKVSILTVVRVVQPSIRELCNDVIDDLLLSVRHIGMTTEVEDDQFLKVQVKRKRFSIIGFIDSAEKYLEYLKGLSPDHLKFRKFFTIVAIQPLNLNEIQLIFESFWKVLVKNVIIINQSDNSSIDLFTFMPFNGEKCGDTRPVKINTYDINLQMWRSDLFHPINKTKNLFNCPLVLGVAIGTGEPYVFAKNGSQGNQKIYGIEKDIFSVFSQIFNFSIQYRVIGSFPGNLYQNGTATGLMKAAIDGEIDAMLGFISLQYTRTVFLSETRMYASVPLAVIVPPGSEYGELEKLTRPFSIEVWIAILVIFAVASFVTIVLSFQSSKLLDLVVGKGVRTPLYNVFAVFYGISLPTLPRKSFARCILMIFIIYSLVLRSVYQGGIYQTMKSNDRKPALSTIKEMIVQKYFFYMYESLASRLVDFEFYPLRKIYPISDINEKRLMTLDPSFKGVVFNYLPQIIYNNQQNFNNYTFTVCKENFYTSPMVFYFKKNHYLVDEINDQLDLLMMNGIVDHFTQRYADPRFLKVHSPNGDRKKLTLTHFKGAFRIHIFMLAIATIAFCVETITRIYFLKNKSGRFLRKL